MKSSPFNIVLGLLALINLMVLQKWELFASDIQQKANFHRDGEKTAVSINFAN